MNNQPLTSLMPSNAVSNVGASGGGGNIENQSLYIFQKIENFRKF